MISILKAALDAAMTTVPGLLMADWMTILEMANTALWMPAGRPIRKMRRRIVRSIRSCFGSRWMCPWRCGCQLAQQRHHCAAQYGHQNGGVNGFCHGFSVSVADSVGNHHIGAQGNANE